jgi:hypothetical protein
MLWVAVTSATELALGCSLDETFQVEIPNEPVVQFWRMEELCSWFEWPGLRICNLLLKPPPDQAQ